MDTQPTTFNKYMNVYIDISWRKLFCVPWKHSSHFLRARRSVLNTHTTIFPTPKRIQTTIFFYGPYLLGSIFHALIESYFSPIAPPFCFWNWMYRIVLAKKASEGGSGVVDSLCISLVINSIKPWIAELVTCEFPFSKK